MSFYKDLQFDFQGKMLDSSLMHNFFLVACYSINFDSDTHSLVELYLKTYRPQKNKQKKNNNLKAIFAINRRRIYWILTYLHSPLSILGEIIQGSVKVGSYQTIYWEAASSWNKSSWRVVKIIGKVNILKPCWLKACNFTKNKLLQSSFSRFFLKIL